MKKYLLLKFLLGILIPICSYGQNLLLNGDFETPGSGKYRGDCQADGCFNGTVPFWFTDPGVTDAGVEPDPARGAYAAFAYNGDVGHIYQDVGPIDAVERDYTLTYWSKVSWSSAAAGTPDEIFFVTYFYSYTSDITSRVIIDSLAVIDEGWSNVEADRDTNYYQHEHRFIVPESEVGKNLAIGFDCTAKNDAVAPSNLWVHFDDMSLIVSNVTGLEESKSKQSIIIYPNPSQGLIEVKSLSSLISTIEIFNITGKIVLTQSNNNIIDLRSNGRGIYFLRAITSNNEIIMKKLIIR